MGSTNKTQYLELPQWIGTDKPTFLGDFNDAFLKIDNGYNTINGTATTAGAQAGQAVEDATSALKKVNDVEDVANTANTNANNALSTANNALTQMGALQTQVSNNADKIEGVENVIDNISNWQTISITPSSGVTQNYLSCKYNPTLKILNLYGTIVTGGVQGGKQIFTLGAPIRPSNERTIYGYYTVNTSNDTVITSTIIIGTNGVVRYSDALGGYGQFTRFVINAMLNVSDWGL